MTESGGNARAYPRCFYFTSSGAGRPVAATKGSVEPTLVLATFEVEAARG